MQIIKVSDTVRFPVRCTYKDEAGTDKTLNFSLVCQRLTQTEISAKLRDSVDEPILDVLAEIVHEWEGLRDVERKPVPYSEDALRAVCDQLPGLAGVMWRTYLTEVGAKEKN
ncbi:hypothetical protein [Acidovorax lacteus]|uniref:Phage protein n=1 Tax=Acidovorax lacteus TaxID=1924988 RepID=A0ABP8KZP9_9BURK